MITSKPWWLENKGQKQAALLRPATLPNGTTDGIDEFATEGEVAQWIERVGGFVRTE